ncbi:MAG: hypothetical protein M3220_00395 [Chloroflexota bacterium]|nr:hypothetical protein [Chloroflexota bacterium]
MEAILYFLAGLIVFGVGLGTVDTLLNHTRRFLEDRHRRKLELMEAQQRLEDARIRNLEIQERILLGYVREKENADAKT